jgi:hypothetical protein
MKSEETISFGTASPAMEHFARIFRRRSYLSMSGADFLRERVRLNAVNSRLKSAAGDIRLMVDPVKAPHVVKDFEGVRLLEGGSGE